MWTCIYKNVHFTRDVVKDLKKIHDLSSKNKWEYAGKLQFVNGRYKGMTSMTSRHRSEVNGYLLKYIWDSEIVYHTHPGIDTDKHLATLPSNADFEVFIKTYPKVQGNIICDKHGYYIIDIHEATYKKTLPLPIAVRNVMNDMRCEEFLYTRVLYNDKIEYFSTDLNEWKNFINSDLSNLLMSNFGIYIHYRGYDELANVVIDA